MGEGSEKGSGPGLGSEAARGPPGDPRGAGRPLSGGVAVDLVPRGASPCGGGPFPSLSRLHPRGAGAAPGEAREPAPRPFPRP